MANIRTTCFNIQKTQHVAKTLICVFYIHGSVHHKSVLIKVQRDATGCSLFYFIAKNTLHVSGVSNTHHQEYIKL
jgi:hypothetical protein